MRDGLEKMYKGCVERDTYVDKEMTKVFQRVDRHRRNLDADHRDIGKLQDEMEGVRDQGVELVAKVASMADKLCHCGENWGSPVLKGEGTEETPFQLEDEELEYQESPPESSSAQSSETEYHEPPVAPEVPEPSAHVHDGCLPTPPPGSTSDQENIPPR